MSYLAFGSVFCRSGGGLLSRGLSLSIMGAGAFHGRVRDGIGCRRSARATRPAEDSVSDQLAVASDQKGTGARRSSFWSLAAGHWQLSDAFTRHGYDFVEVSECIKPIERLVRLSFTHCCAFTCRLSTWWSSTALKRDLVLRWVSRLDAFSGYPVHTIATRLRGWRHDRSTRGMSIPVLSY